MNDDMYQTRMSTFAARQADGTRDTAEALRVWVRENGGQALVFPVPGQGYAVAVQDGSLRPQARAGRWIRMLASGRFEVWEDAAFREMFEPAPAASA